MDRGSEARGRFQLLILVFVITRVLLVYLADNPDHYGTPTSKIVGDVDGYRLWADKILDEGITPYIDFPIEYPPAVIPFALVSEVGPENAYRLTFVLIMVALDVSALWALYRIGARRRSTSLLGPWVWVFGVLALGPITYLRLDLIPAIATIWALERASAAKWGQGGAWLGFGIAAKIYPVLLLPAYTLMARRKLVAFAGTAAVIALTLLPFVDDVGSVFTNVFGYHSDRGVQVESTWAAGLQLAESFGYPIGIEYTFGAFHLVSGASATLKSFSNVAALLAVGLGTLFAFRFARRDDPGLTREVSFATLALVLAVGTVFSPQFMVWLLALAALVACDERSPLAVPALAVLPLCAMTQFIYPFAYDQLIIGGGWRIPARLLLAARNVGVLAIGISSFVILARRRWSEGSTPAPVRPEPEPQPT